MGLLGALATFLVGLLVVVIMKLSVVEIVGDCAREIHDPLVVLNAYGMRHFPPLVRRLRDLGFGATQIIVVLSECEEEGVTVEATHVQVNVRHNSIDFTALIALLEHKTAIDRALGYTSRAFFYLHDTCVVGPRFKTRLSRKFRNQSIRLTSTLLWPISGCNLGLYAFDDLRLLRDELLEQKTFPTTDQERLKAKLNGIFVEDLVFDRLGVREAFQYVFDYSGERRHGRLKLYAESLDLIKSRSVKAHAWEARAKNADTDT